MTTELNGSTVRNRLYQARLLKEDQHDYHVCLLAKCRTKDVPADAPLEGCGAYFTIDTKSFNVSTAKRHLLNDSKHIDLDTKVPYAVAVAAARAKRRRDLKLPPEEQEVEQDRQEETDENFELVQLDNSHVTPQKDTISSSTVLKQNGDKSVRSTAVRRGSTRSGAGENSVLAAHWKPGSEAYQNAAEKFTEWIVATNQPLNTGEQKSFREMIHALNPFVTLPIAATVRDTHIRALTTKLTKRIISQLQNQETIAISTDLGSADPQRYVHVLVPAHFTL